MRLFTFVVIMSVLVAGVASAKPPLLRGHLSRVKNFIFPNEGIPSGLHKALAGAVVAGMLWGLPLAADYNSTMIATQTRGSDTALQEQIEQEKGSDTALEVDFPWEAWNVRLSQLDLAYQELSVRLRNMRAYDPDFASTAAAFREQERNWQTTNEEYLQALKETGYSDKVVTWPTAALAFEVRKYLEVFEVRDSIVSRRRQISYWIEGVRGVGRENISWTAKHGTVGIDYRDVKHYRTVKDTLTAQDYDGVSVHYFVDGKSYRGVADAIHPELAIKVRVGTRVINVAQISGVRISLYSQPRKWLSRYYDLQTEKPMQVVAEPHIAEPLELLKLLDPKYGSGRYYGRIRGHLTSDEGVKIYWDGFQRTENPHDYTDGYGEFRVQRVGLHTKKDDGSWGFEDNFFLKEEDSVVLVNYGGLPAPTVSVSGVAWDLYDNDIFTSAYGDELQVYGIANDLQLRFYERRVDGLPTAADYDYRGVLARYRQGDTNYTAQVLGARDVERSDTLGVVVVDLVTGEEKRIAVADIQGVLLLKQSDYGRAVTIKIGDTDYYGELFLAFSNGELTALIHATRQSEGVELLDDRYTITVHREDEGLILH